MDEITSKETVVRATVENISGKNLPNSTPETTRLRNALAENGPRSALESMRVQPVDKKQVESSLDAWIPAAIDTVTGLEMIDPVTGKKIRPTDSPEAREFQRLKNTTDKVEKYLSEYQTLTDNQKNAIIVKIEPELRRSVPEINILLSEPGVDSKEILKPILDDPEFATILRQKLLDITNPDPENRISQDLLNSVPRLREAYLKKQELAKREKTELTKTKKEYKQTQTKLNEYQDGKSKDIGKLRTEEEIKTELAPLDKQVKDKQREITRIERAIQAAERAGNAGEVLRLGGEKDRLEDDISAITESDDYKDLNKELAERNARVKEKEDLEQKLIELDGQVTSLGEKLITDQIQARMASDELADVVRQIREKREEYEGKIENIFDTASVEYISKKIETAEGVARGELTKLKEEAKDKATKAMAEALISRYEERYNDRGELRKRIKNDKDMILGDFADLMKNGSPDSNMESILRHEKLTPEEIKYLRENKDEWNKLREQYVKRLFIKWGQIGRKPNDAEAEIILDSDWGADLIGEIGKIPELQQRLEDLRKDGKLDGGLVDWMKRHPKRSVVLLPFLLALLAGLPFAMVGKGIVNGVQSAGEYTLGHYK